MYGYVEVLGVRKIKYLPTMLLCKCHNCGRIFEIKRVNIGPNYKGHCGCLPHALKGRYKEITRELTPLQQASVNLKTFMHDIKQGDYDVK